MSFEPIRFVKQYGSYLPGAVTDQIPGGVADVLVRRKIATHEPRSPVEIGSHTGKSITSDAIDLGELVEADQTATATGETPKSSRQRNRK